MNILACIAGIESTDANSRSRQSAAMDWVRLLAEEIGPRRPTSDAERQAAGRIRDELAARGLDARLEEFRGYASFAEPFGAIIALGLAPALLPRRRRLLRSLLAATAAAGLVTEGSLVNAPLSNLLSRRPSQNLVATIDPRGTAERTLCLVCHLDTSRSGLLFHPKLAPHLQRWLALQSAACLAQAGEPLLAMRRAGRLLLAGCRAVLAVGGGLLLERELRGEDVPGANDNASGVGVVAQLGLELMAAPAERTRVVILMTGCEESGTLGAEAFLHSRDTSGWLFLNFDNIGGPATLRYLLQEGVVTTWDADARLAALAARVSGARPELGLQPSDGRIGLTYDVSRVLARGGRALTLVAADGGVIPNYHWPTDTAENVDPTALERALEVGRELIARIDQGEAD